MALDKLVFKAYGIEPSENAPMIATQLACSLNSRIMIRDGNAEKIPFKDNFF